MHSSIIITCGLLCYLCIGSASAYQCYMCYEPMGHGINCENDPTNVGRKECPAPNVCSVYVTTKGDGTKMLTRGCDIKTICDANGIEKNTCKTCETDLCNSSPNLFTSFGLITSLYLIVLKYF